MHCKKVALYPDYNYCGTRWKAIDIYRYIELRALKILLWGRGSMADKTILSTLPKTWIFDRRETTQKK